MSGHESPTGELAVTQQYAALLLELEWDFPQVGQTTIRGYLCAILSKVWEEGDAFTFKRAFGFSGWQADLLAPLIAAGAIDGSLDEDRRLVAVSDEQRGRGLALVASLIQEMGRSVSTEVATRG